MTGQGQGPPAPLKPSGLGIWVAGARPRTLPAAVAPVLVGTAVAVGHVVVWRAVAALVVALAVQVMTNYFNDHADGVRGTDAARVGPVRLVASRLATPGQVLRAAAIAGVAAAAAGATLAAAVGPELLIVGAACFAAGYLYTGGPRPYGYAGLGEVFVFAFFGLVATAGSAYVHLERVSGLALLAAVPVGCLATALLVVNNLRDRPTDGDTGKRTLAVRIGDGPTRTLYLALVVVAFLALPALAISRPWSLLAASTLPLAASPLRAVREGAAGKDLVPVLGDTGRLQLAYGVVLAFGLSVTV